mmetsp:Transcript_36468/g.116890  ORF Transcript_36468/g.116890 Transcript_36468/m.116890 type:complete len:203 (-) Transcript_36468:773-1381(-)
MYLEKILKLHHQPPSSFRLLVSLPEIDHNNICRRSLTQRRARHIMRIFHLRQFCRFRTSTDRPTHRPPSTHKNKPQAGSYHRTPSRYYYDEVVLHPHIYTRPCHLASQSKSVSAHLPSYSPFVRPFGINNELERRLASIYVYSSELCSLPSRDSSCGASKKPSRRRKRDPPIRKESHVVDGEQEDAPEALDDEEARCHDVKR